MAYKHAYLNTLLLLHFTFMLNVVKMLLKGEVGGHALNSHGNTLLIMKNHGKIMKLCFEFLWEPCGKEVEVSEH